MKILFRAHTVGALVFLGFASMVSLAKAGAPSTCDQISTDVREAVGKDPSKVLMIVEDALVINESCACEIIKAAIMASSADAAMVHQIVQTALAVAPKMAAVIAECAAAAAPGSGEAVAALAGGKVAPSVPVAEGTNFSNAWATNIRGVYLIQPAAAGFITQVADSDDTDEEDIIQPAAAVFITQVDDSNDTDEGDDGANREHRRDQEHDHRGRDPHRDPKTDGSAEVLSSCEAHSRGLGSYGSAIP